jgi:hypothetical protein
MNICLLEKMKHNTHLGFEPNLKKNKTPKNSSTAHSRLIEVGDDHHD